MCEFWQRGCYTGLPLCDLVEEMSPAPRVKPLDEFVTAYDLSERRDNKTKCVVGIPG